MRGDEQAYSTTGQDEFASDPPMMLGRKIQSAESAAAGTK
jgi:hypothetical protein